MKSLPSAILAAALLLCPACTTSKLWENTDPATRILLDADTTSEATLHKLGVDYAIVEIGDWKGYSVEKSTLRKALDLHLRLAGTPPALALDAAGTILAMVALNPDVWCGVIQSIACAVND